MNGGEWFAVCLAGLTLWVLLSGLDELFLQGTLLVRRAVGKGGPRWPGAAELEAAPRRRIAVFVPLWREEDVIARMLEHNLANTGYPELDFFVGVYPNDAPTANAVRGVARRFPNVHVARCPHDGPTSKADCLNWIYQRMLLHEERFKTRFEVVAIHDAEDVIHPEALRLINYFAGRYDMIQVPVLPLPTPLSDWTHGLYCDEFAESQTKDIPVRQALGGFIASSGVGTGFTRAALDELADKHSGRIFEPTSLTEDYDAGFRIHNLRRPQLFLPLRVRGGSVVATREYFPRDFRAAVKQRTRWVMGIALQSWERYGWRAPARQLYWLWRDRKGLVGNLISPLTNVLFAWGAVVWLLGVCAGCGWGAWLWENPVVKRVCALTLFVSVAQIGFRGAATARIYGWRFAAAAPARAVWGNWVNGAATALALWRYFSARARGRPLVWLKTEHMYPSRAALTTHRRRLGEVLVALGYVSTADLELALAVRREGERIGECLVRLGKLTGEGLNRGLDTMGPPADPADRTRPPSIFSPPASECIAPLRGGA